MAELKTLPHRDFVWVGAISWGYYAFHCPTFGRTTTYDERPFSLMHSDIAPMPQKTSGGLGQSPAGSFGGNTTICCAHPHKLTMPPPISRFTRTAGVERRTSCTADALRGPMQCRFETFSVTVDRRSDLARVFFKSLYIVLEFFQRML